MGKEGKEKGREKGKGKVKRIGGRKERRGERKEGRKEKGIKNELYRERVCFLPQVTMMNYLSHK